MTQTGLQTAMIFSAVNWNRMAAVPSEDSSNILGVLRRPPTYVISDAVFAPPVPSCRSDTQLPRRAGFDGPRYAAAATGRGLLDVFFPSATPDGGILRRRQPTAGAATTGGLGTGTEKASCSKSLLRW
jgi:hypothetical protein